MAGAAGDPKLKARVKIIYFFFFKRNRIYSRADETGNSGSIAHNIPRIIRHNHIHQDITGINLFFYFHSLAGFYFYFLFNRNNDIKNFIVHPERINTLTQIAKNHIFISSISMNSVPISSSLCFLF